jgi:hypothetical protein
MPNQRDFKGYEVIQVPNTNLVIAREQDYGGLERDQALRELRKDRVFMATPAILNRHMMNVKDVVEKSKPLYDGDGKVIPEDEAREIWNYLTCADGRDLGAWTWLNARFEKGSGYEGLDVVAEDIVTKSGKGWEFKDVEQPLDKCVEQDYVDITDFNEQGFGRRKSKVQESRNGRNVFCGPIYENSVAGVGANSGGVFLVCNRDPQVSSAALGVLWCAERSEAREIRRRR